MSTNIYVDAWIDENGCMTRGELNASVSLGLIELTTNGMTLFTVDPYHARKLGDLLHTLCDSMEAE